MILANDLARGSARPAIGVHMSGPTSPAASSIALPVVVAPPSVNAPGVPSFAAFCDVILGKIALPGAKPKTGDDDRQADAATGKILPDTDKDVDPALAWLFGATLLPTPTPPPASPPSTTTAPPAILELAPDIAPDVLIASPGSDVKPEATDQTGTCDVVIGKPGMLKPSASESNTTPEPIRLPLLSPRLPADRSAAPPPVAAAALPALFALAMDRARRDDDSTTSPTVATVALSQQTTSIPIAPIADTQRQMLDMGRQDWPQKMIDHIEALRDNADANDTSIRLKPEALGRVDIALKTHEGGAISVRFTAEQPTTRTLLVDAAPQLSAAAEARGIRLSGTSVDLSGQGDQRPQPQAEAAKPITNRLATPRGDDNQAVDDGRIA